MVKYCQTVRPERLWPRPNIYGHAWQKIYQTTCFIYCYLGGLEIHTDFLMRYQLIDLDNGLALNWQQALQIFGNVSMANKMKLGNINCWAPEGRKPREDVVKQL